MTERRSNHRSVNELTMELRTPPPGQAFETGCSLRVVDGDLYAAGQSAECLLPAHLGRRILVGRSEECDFVLDDPAVSRRHVLVERVSQSEISVTQHENASSRPKCDDLRFRTRIIGPGGVFRLGRTSLMLCTVAMRQARATLAWWLGRAADEARAVDSLLAEVTCGGPILILGDASLWPGRLARFLHTSVSVRSAGPFTEIGQSPPTAAARAEAIEGCHGGGVLITLPNQPGSEKVATAALVRALLDAGVASYVTAGNVDIARSVLGDDLQARFRSTRIPPLKDRLDEMDVLLGGMLRWLNQPYAAHQFLPNLPALQALRWRRNLDDLEVVTLRLVALGTRGFNDAAREVGTARGTLYDWRKRYGLVDLALTPIRRAETKQAAEENPTSAFGNEPTVSSRGPYDSAEGEGDT
jgi:hypothetical protein